MHIVIDYFGAATQVVNGHNTTFHLKMTKKSVFDHFSKIHQKNRNFELFPPPKNRTT